MELWKHLTNYFYRYEFAIKNNIIDVDEINVHPAFLTYLNSFRLWLGRRLIVHSGCRKGNGKSAHDICFIKYQDGAIIRLSKQCTAADVSTSNLNCWKLMEKVEEFDEKNEHTMFMGKGVYPHTKHSTIHLDSAQYCPFLYKKRIKTVRWVAVTSANIEKRKKGLWDYHYATQNESFKELKIRLEKIGIL